MAFDSFASIYEELNRFVPPMRARREAYTLERIQQLMKFLGNPQDSFKVIHVAGTSGKTSTAYFITSLLVQAGQKVGLTVSPHIDDVNERVQINLKPLSEKIFGRELEHFIQLVKTSGIKPTYFELLVAFAYWEFAKAKVDYAVVEVGLGGLLDATNVITRSDKVCVITDIGLDHVEVLGRTISAITAQKAGIIRPYNPVFMYEQGEEVMQVVREVCEQEQAELHEVWKVAPRELPANLVLFQRHNWYLAYNVFSFIQSRDSLPALSEAALAASTAVYIPGRMEIFQLEGKTIVLDGAHNTQKIGALRSSMRKQFPRQTYAVLFSLLQSKSSRMKSVLKQVTSMASHIIVTSIAGHQDAYKPSIDPLKIVEQCYDLGFEAVEIVADAEQAFLQILRRPEEVILVTGSFYLLNSIRTTMKHMDKRT